MGAKRTSMQVSIEAILKAHGLLKRWQAGKVTAVKLTQQSYMPLVIKQVTTLTGQGIKPAVSVAHYFEQNGDIMYDPEIVFTADQWEATEITQHPLGRYTAKYMVGDKGQMMMRITFACAVGMLVDMWARNLREQGWADTASTHIERAE